VLANFREGTNVIYYALAVFIVALVSGAMSLIGDAPMASQVSWIMSLVGIVLLFIHVVAERRTPTT
jgi:uncharacterized membrane protein YtjA (UPF0391 family)